MARKKQHTDLEVVQKGFANGVSPNFPLNGLCKLLVLWLWPILGFSI